MNSTTALPDPYESRQTTVIGVTTFVLAVTAIAVSLRVYTRAFILRQFGVDDWIAVVTFVRDLILGPYFNRKPPY
jgi:hypothetical protein